MILFESIDWSEPSCKISKYFTVKDAIFLERWGRLARESDGLTEQIKRNIHKMANEKMDMLRELIGRAIYIKSWFRSSAYNVLIGGAKFSMHMTGFAVDWWADMDGDGDRDGFDCDRLKEFLLKKGLQVLGLRMEDNGKGATWIHNDTKEVPLGGRWYFLP